MAESATICEEESGIEKDFCTQSFQSNSNPGLCTQDVLHDEDEKLKIADDSATRADFVTICEEKSEVKNDTCTQNFQNNGDFNSNLCPPDELLSDEDESLKIIEEITTRANEITISQEESGIKKDICIQRFQNNSNFNPKLCSQDVQCDEDKKMKIVDESETRYDRISIPEEKSEIKKDFCTQSFQNNSNLQPNLCPQDVVYVEDEKLKIVDESALESTESTGFDSKQPLKYIDDITESVNDNADSSPTNQINDILVAESSSLSSNKNTEQENTTDIAAKEVTIEIPINDEKASENNAGEEKVEGTEAAGENKKSSTKKEKKLIWIILEWTLIVVIGILIIVALSGMIYFFCKGKKAYVSSDDSKKAYMENHHMTEEDYEIEVRNNRTLARAKYPWNPYLWLPDASSWG